jgi:hypothetical protein
VPQAAPTKRQNERARTQAYAAPDYRSIAAPNARNAANGHRHETRLSRAATRPQPRAPATTRCERHGQNHRRSPKFREACLTCPLFITTAQFLPQHREQHRQTLQIISAAKARGQARMVEMNQQVADNLQRIITTLEADDAGETAAAEAVLDAS